MSLQAVAEALADGLDIRYQHVVDKITWSHQKVQVSCANGVSLEADAVIVTVSLGVLKVVLRALSAPRPQIGSAK